jgi:hypothetical protein
MRIALLAVAAFFSATPANAQSGCPLTGVWELVSGKADGQAYPATGHMVKFITRNHWAWVTQDDSGPRQLRTTADSLAAFGTNAGGSGTYTVTGSTYTETIALFPDPAYVGLSIPFTCRVDGDHFHQTGNFPILRDGKKVRDAVLEEVYRRIE